MKKMKTLILALALGFTVAGAATAVGCGDGGSSGNVVFTETVENLASITFDKTEVSVYQYEGATLSCFTKGITTPITYTSSDSSVVAVDENGNVTASDKVGQAVITAKAGDVSATCVVKVEKSPYHPQIILNSKKYTVEENGTLEFNVSTEWNKTELSENIQYSVSFAENSQDANATISTQGDVVKVVATTAETFDVVVSATVRGLYTSEQFTVNVVAPKLKITPANEAFTPGSGEYEVTISATDQVAWKFENSVPMDFSVAKGSQKLSNADVNWTVEGDAASLVGGNLVGNKVGTVTLTGTVEHEGETATIKINCNVVPPELTLEETIVLDLSAKNLTFKLESTFIGKLDSAYLHGEKVSSVASGQTIAFKKDTFPKTASLLGAQELILNTTLVRYKMPVEIYTMIINDKDELDQMRIIANTGEVEYSNRFSNEQGVDVYRNAQFFDGYFILGNDIAYNGTIMSMTDTGSVWGVQGYQNDDRGFKGVFDGRGYNIDGVTVGNNPSGDKKQAGGIFGYIATGGIVKNVSFTNAVLQENGGFICSRGNGTVENVSISYKKIGGDKETSSTNTMGSFFSLAASPKATVKNCLVDASAAEINLEYTGDNKNVINLHLIGRAKNVENVIALCPDTRVLEASGADIQRRTYNDLIAESELMENFDKTYWTSVQGVPMFVNQAATLNRDLEVDFLGVKSSLVAGFSMLVLANNPYTTIELVPVEGVTFENSMLSATEVAFTKSVTLKVTSLFNPDNTKTIEVYIDSFGTKVDAPTTETAVVYYNNPVLQIGDNSWMGDKNYVYIGADIYSVGEGEGSITIDWKKFGWEKQAVTVVSVKGDVRTHFDANVQIIYPVSDFKDSAKLIDSSIFARTIDVNHVLFDVEMEEDEMKAPEGYEMISRIDSNTTWSSALPREFFNATDLSGYKEIWFSIKIVNGFWVMRATQQYSITGWVSFHYIQIESGVWAVEVSVDGEHFITEYNVNGKDLRNMTYRDGWGNGLLLYNNQGKRPDGETTKIYATEVRGILK